MTHLFIDREAATFDQSAQTWADLLNALDRALDARGRVVTEVHFDGVGEPTFRAPGALATPLTSVARIDAATATPDELLRDCLLEAAGSVALLGAECPRVASLFRTTDVTHAQARLATLAQELGQLMQLIQTLQGPLGLATAATDESPADERAELDRFTTFVSGVLDAERGGDYLTVADMLEDDLVPFLRAWQGRFERLAG